jgi:hypothetical protein
MIEVVFKDKFTVLKDGTEYELQFLQSYVKRKNIARTAVDACHITAISGLRRNCFLACEQSEVPQTISDSDGCFLLKIGDYYRRAMPLPNYRKKFGIKSRNLLWHYIEKHTNNLMVARILSGLKTDYFFVLFGDKIPANSLCRATVNDNNQNKIDQP